MATTHVLTGDERASLVAWIEQHPSAVVRFGRRQYAADVRRDGEVGYLQSGGAGDVRFIPRHSRFERPVAGLHELEIKVGARYRAASRVLGDVGRVQGGTG